MLNIWLTSKRKRQTEKNTRVSRKNNHGNSSDNKYSRDQKKIRNEDFVFFHMWRPRFGF